MNNHVLTEIKQTKKGRYALFFDDQFYFSVDEEVLVRHHLKVGTAFSDLDIENFKKESDYNKAKEKAFRLLSIRDHSEKELYDKLQDDITKLKKKYIVFMGETVPESASKWLDKFEEKTGWKRNTLMHKSTKN